MENRDAMLPSPLKLLIIMNEKSTDRLFRDTAYGSGIIIICSSFRWLLEQYNNKFGFVIAHATGLQAHHFRPTCRGKKSLQFVTLVDSLPIYGNPPDLIVPFGNVANNVTCARKKSIFEGDPKLINILL